MAKTKASLGIDIGTSGTKLVLIDHSGEQRAYITRIMILIYQDRVGLNRILKHGIVRLLRD